MDAFFSRLKYAKLGIKKLDLVDHKHKTADSLSGGNKRKLQVAIAIIGNP
jgi:ABC-type multidrug transport system ATPase subunit